MNEKKFPIPAIIFSAIGCICAFFMMPVEAIAAGGIGMILSVRKRETHRVKLPVVLGVIAVLCGLLALCWYCYIGKQGVGGSSYWLFRIFFT